MVYSLQGKKVLCVAHPGLWKEDAVDGMSFWEFADDDFSCEIPDEGSLPSQERWDIRGFELFSLEKRRLRIDFIVAFQHLKGAYEKN